MPEVRIDDNVAPARAKCTGIYVSSALAKSEAMENGFDEAIVLNQDGHVCEGSAENIFLVRNGQFVTPSASDNILEGITRATLMHLIAEEMGMDVVERPVDRTELYVADEAFFCGSGYEITPIVSIDRFPLGDGAVGSTTRRLLTAYMNVVRGIDTRRPEWRTPVYRPITV